MASMTDGWKIIQNHIVYVEGNKVIKGIEPLDGDKCRTVYVYKRNRFGVPDRTYPSPESFRKQINTDIIYMKAKESIYD